MRALVLLLLSLLLSPATSHAQAVPALPIAWLSDRDGDVDVYVWDGEQTLNVSNNNTTDNHIRQSADGQIAWLGVVDGSSEVFVWDGQQTLNLSESPGYEFVPAWSNDGRLAWWSQQRGGTAYSVQIAVWDGEQTRLLGHESGWADIPPWTADGGQVSPMWSDDGRLAWYASDDNGLMQIYVWDGRHVIQLTNGNAGHMHYLAWLENGDLLWTMRHPLLDTSESTSLWLWDGTQLITLVEPSDAVIEWTLWGDDQLAFRVGTRADAPVYIWTETGVVRINPEQSGLVGYPSGSAQGQLAWRAEVDGRPRLYVWDGAAVHDVGWADGTFPVPVWSADGRLAWNTQTADGMHIYVWDGNTISDIPPDKNQYDSALMWLPDGRLVWQSGDSPLYELKFWDRGRIGTITIGAGPIRDVRVHLAGLLWTQVIDGNTDMFLWDGTQTINVSSDPAWDGFAIVSQMG